MLGACNSLKRGKTMEIDSKKYVFCNLRPAIEMAEILWEHELPYPIQQYLTRELPREEGGHPVFCVERKTIKRVAESKIAWVTPHISVWHEIRVWQETRESVNGIIYHGHFEDS